MTDGVPRWKDLSRSERAAIANGCGPKGGWLKAPDWFFEACCDHHDFRYWRGCTAKHRKEADEQFYAAMLRDVNRLGSRWMRPWMRFVAWGYYRAVRYCGAPHFFYGARQRTRFDLADWLREEGGSSRRGET